MKDRSMRSLLFVLLALTVFSGGQATAADRPHIRLIVSEDNGPELGCSGDLDTRTPNLDRLATVGILFCRAYVPQAGCSQSRARLLSGFYPHRHGQIGLATSGFRLFRNGIPALSRCLKSAGYKTGMMGKRHRNPAAGFINAAETPLS